MSENLENKADYGAGNIQVLEGLEAVEKDQPCILVISVKKVYTI